MKLRNLLCVMLCLALALGCTSAFAEAAPVSVYDLITDSLNLAGIVDPNMKDRAELDKAWPRTPAVEGALTIGWTECNQSSDWFIAVKQSAEETAKKYGYTLNFLVAEDDTATQDQQIDTFISQGVDIIVVDPINSAAPVASINRAVAEGIPVLCTGAVPGDCAALTTLCSNTFMNGYVCGQYIAKQYDASEAINACMLVGVMGSSCTESRLCGAVAGIMYARRELKGNPYAADEDAWLDANNLWQEIKTTGKGVDEASGLNVLGYGTGSWTIEGGLTASEDLITANSTVMNLMLAENDFMANGAIKALKSADLMETVKVAACADGTADGLNMIKNGELLCTGMNSGIEQGSWAIEFIHAIFDGGADPSDLPLASCFTPGCISAENVDSFIDEDAGNKFYKTQDFTFPQSIPEIKAAAGIAE